MVTFDPMVFENIEHGRTDCDYNSLHGTLVTSYFNDIKFYIPCTSQIVPWNVLVGEASQANPWSYCSFVQESPHTEISKRNIL